MPDVSEEHIAFTVRVKEQDKKYQKKEARWIG
jgi:hypothetical protein